MGKNKFRRRLSVLGLIATVALVPALAFAQQDGFVDVPEDHLFHDDISWMQDAGVTRGCNPPENTEYCPERGLTRGEEAAFFHRYDSYIRDSLDNRLLPEECEAGQTAMFDGESWMCADTGDTGPFSLAIGEPVTIPNNAAGDVTAECAAGEIALSGTVTPIGPDVVVTDITTTNGSVTMTVTNNTGATADFTGYAVCAAA